MIYQNNERLKESVALRIVTYFELNVLCSYLKYIVVGLSVFLDWAVSRKTPRGVLYMFLQYVK